MSEITECAMLVAGGTIGAILIFLAQGVSNPIMGVVGFALLSFAGSLVFFEKYVITHFNMQP